MKQIYDSSLLKGGRVNPGPARPEDPVYHVDGQTVELAFGDTVSIRKYGSGLFLPSLSDPGPEMDEMVKIAYNTLPWYEVEASGPEQISPAIPAFLQRLVFAPTYPGSQSLHMSRQVLTFAMGDVAWVNIGLNTKLVERQISDEDRTYTGIVQALRHHLSEGVLSRDDCFLLVAEYLPETAGDLQQRVNTLKSVFEPHPSGDFRTSLMAQVLLLRTKCKDPRNARNATPPPSTSDKVSMPASIAQSAPRPGR